MAQFGARLLASADEPLRRHVLHYSEFVDEESRRAAMEGAHAIDEAARHRTVVDETDRQSRTP